MTDARPTAAAPEPGEGAPAANPGEGAPAATITVAGAAGRMGSRIIALHREAGLRLAAALEAPGHRALGRDAGEVAGAGVLGVPLTADAAAAITRERVLIEFSVPEASLEHLRLVARAGARAVIGTTGFSAIQRDEIATLARAAFLETNPIPIKEAMAMAGMIEPEFRLPMCRMGDANRETLRGVLRQYGLVK